MHSSDDNLKPATSTRAKGLKGRISVPGDKSISHRALMLASQALGITTIHGLLEGDDVLATADALRKCGVPITRHTNGTWEVSGRGIGGLHAPADVLDMGNAGTAARLMMGLLAPYPYTVHFTGDASLRKRPMQRVITPLELMGARFTTREGGRLPLAMTGSATTLPITYELPVASAQVKSAILLAGLNTAGTTTVIEHEATRDHSERMLRFFGINVETKPHTNNTVIPAKAEISVSTSKSGEGDSRLCGNDKATNTALAISITGQQSQTYQDRSFEVPADPSSAAFPIVAALLVPGSEVTVTNVCLNPLRTGLFDVLKQMGADLSITNRREVGGEDVGDITARHSTLKPADTKPSIAPSMIDEYPILAIAAACANGKSIMRGLSELRVKESDRLAAIIAGLTANGVNAYAEGDDLIVEGNGKSPKGGGIVTTHFDHRIAMSFFILGLVAQSPVTVDDTRAIATSFPSFLPLMKELGA